MQNPLTPAGIEPVTFRFVTQHLNHCAAAVPGSFGEDKNLLLIPGLKPQTMQPIAYSVYCATQPPEHCWASSVSLISSLCVRRLFL